MIAYETDFDQSPKDQIIDFSIWNIGKSMLWFQKSKMVIPKIKIIKP